MVHCWLSSGYVPAGGCSVGHSFRLTTVEDEYSIRSLFRLVPGSVTMIRPRRRNSGIEFVKCVVA